MDDEPPAPAPLPEAPRRKLPEPADQEDAAADKASMRDLLLLTRLDALSDDVLLSPEEAAAILNRSKFTLRHWRMKVANHPLRWLKYGRRIRYRVADVRAFARGEAQPRRRHYKKPSGFAPAK